MTSGDLMLRAQLDDTEKRLSLALARCQSLQEKLDRSLKAEAEARLLIKSLYREYCDPAMQSDKTAEGALICIQALRFQALGDWLKQALGDWLKRYD